MGRTGSQNKPTQKSQFQDSFQLQKGVYTQEEDPVSSVPLFSIPTKWD